jgi:hypothetical protein
VRTARRVDSSMLAPGRPRSQGRRRQAGSTGVAPATDLSVRTTRSVARGRPRRSFHHRQSPSSPGKSPVDERRSCPVGSRADWRSRLQADL